MEMEGSGVSPLAQPPPAKEVDEAALALTKRARKRSRYLSPPYTDTDVQEKEAAGGGGSHKQQEEEEEEVPPDVSAGDVLSALRAAALWQAQGQGADATPLRFLELYRNRDRSSIFFDNHPDPHATASGASDGGGSNKPPSAAGVGFKMLSLNAGSDDGALAKKKKKKKKNTQPPVTAAVKQQNGPMEKAALLEQAVHEHIWASQSPGFAANVTYGVSDPVVLPKKKKCRKRMKSPVQHNYFGNPVSLVLDFTEGTPLPSKADLISTFRRFGFVIDSETAINNDKRSASVAFAARAQAEAAYSCAETLGTFGPPFAAPRLQDLPPITLSTYPPVPKLPLMDIKSNLEKMILSLTCSSSSFKAIEGAANSPPEARLAPGNLVGEMQGLLARVNKKLQATSANDHHHH